MNPAEIYKKVGKVIFVTKYILLQMSSEKYTLRNFAIFFQNNTICEQLLIYNL